MQLITVSITGAFSSVEIIASYERQTALAFLQKEKTVAANDCFFVLTQEVLQHKKTDSWHVSPVLKYL